MKTTKILLVFAFLLLGAFPAMGFSGVANPDLLSTSLTNTKEPVIQSANYDLIKRLITGVSFNEVITQNDLTAPQAGRPDIIWMRGGQPSITNQAFYSPNGQMIAVNNGAQVKIYRSSDGILLLTVESLATGFDCSNPKMAPSFAFSPDNQKLAVMVDAPQPVGKAVQFWNISNGVLELSITASANSGVAYSPDGTKIIAGRSVYTVSDGALLHFFPLGFNPAFYSPNGQFIYGSTQTTNYCESGVNIMEFSGLNYSAIRTIGTNNGIPQTISPDGQYLINNYPGDVIRVSNGTVVQSLGASGPSPYHSYSFSPNGQYVAVGRSFYRYLGQVPVLIIKRTSDWSTVRTYNPDETTSSNDVGVVAVSFSADSQTLATSTWDTKLWSVADGSLIKTLSPIYASGVNGLTFSPDGQTIATATGESGRILSNIQLWNTSDGSKKNINFLQTQGVAINQILFTPNGQNLLTIGGNGLNLWNAANGAFVRNYTVSGSTIALSPDGQTIAVGSGNTTNFYRLSDGTTLSYNVSGAGYGGVYSPDGQIYAAHGSFQSQASLNLYNASNGALIRGIITGANANGGGPSRLPGNTAFSTDGTLIAYITEATNNFPRSGFIKIYRVSDGTLVRSIGQFDNWGASVVFTKDSQSVIATGWDATVRIWRVSDGANLKTYTNETGGQPGSNYALGQIALSPDGSKFAYARADSAFVVANNPYNTPQTYSIGGQITNNNGSALSGATVALSGASSATVTTDASGNYSFANLTSGGNYTVTPTLANYTFAPVNRSFSNLAANQPGQNFVGTAAATCTYALSPTSANVVNTAGSGSFSITTQAGCAWTAQSSSAFLTTSSTGSGSGTVNYAYAANTGAARSATITVGGQTFTLNQAGTPSPCTNGVAVSLPNINAARNAVITVPITVGDTTGKNITSFDFDLRFDSTIVRPVAASPTDTTGTLSSGFTVTPNANAPGKLVVSAFGVNTLAGAGTLLNLKFEVIGNPSQVSNLSWAAFQFNEGDPCAATAPGSITIVNGAIAGNINYHFVASGQQPKAMANVAVTAAGTPQISAATNASGAYRLDGFGAGAYTVTPAKTGDVNGISSQDAARVAQFVAGLVTLTANQQIAADATNNGSVSSQDAARIAQYVAGITVAGATGQWKFAPASRSYSAVTSELTGENYDAILVGEVTGNWTAPSSRSNEAETESKIKRIFAEKLLDAPDAAPNAVNVSLPTMTANTGTTITIPVTVGNLTGQNVTSYDFDVRFNQAVLRPISATPTSNAGTLSSNFTITPNPNTPGKLVVSAFGIAPLSGEGNLLNLNFEVIGQAGAVSPLTWQMFAFNEGDPAATTANGQLTIPGTIRRTPFDFDGDGKADVSVFRPDNGVWYFSNSQTGFGGVQFGLGTDKLVPADYDGDGKTDVAVFRNGTWYILRSSAGFTGVSFGATDDVLVPADYDGDGKADIAVFRPSTGVWYRLNSSNGAFVYDVFGLSTDKPVPADYDGDGKANVAVFRPSNGTWYTSTNPATNYGAVVFGDANDKPVPADYDGDGKVDVAVFRPSNGTWYLNRSTGGFTGIAFGFGTDLPTPADYDGDGKADVAVFRNGTWYLQRSTSGFTGIAFGAATDKPIPNVFVR